MVECRANLFWIDMIPPYVGYGLERKFGLKRGYGCATKKV